MFIISVFVLLVTGLTVVSGPDVIKVVVKEGEDAILPCSLSTKENIEFKLFDWKKDGQKKVFMYDAGYTYNNGLTGQDEQFRGRVFHFPDQLKVSNASILIKQTKVTDRGNYTCDFPRLQPQRRFHIELVVGAAPEPTVTALKVTQHNAVLQCEVQGAFPKPQIQWQDSDKNIIPAEEPQDTESEVRYDVILNTTVTKTDTYRCVVTQEEINHQVYSDIYVNISGSGFPIGWVIGVGLVCFLVATGVARGICCNKRPDVITVKEGKDAILLCSLSTKENIESKLFDWKKDGQKEVFLYDAGVTYVGPDVVKVVVKEGEDAILPYSLSTKENIEFKLFHWKKDKKEVFLYDAGRTYGNDLKGQDEQFRGRVFHFPDQLKVGDASIVIKQTKVTDRGNYTCDFPRLQPQRHIELVVE